MNRIGLRFFAVSLLLLLALGGSAWAKEFTQADLEKMVVELDKVIPENKGYLYPVKCSIVDDKEVNAYATVRKEGEGKRATMVVFTGIVKAMDGNERLIRAVVAHELSHLSRGHLSDIDPAARDLRNLWTRQQEFEADKFGAEALVKAGYPKKDMVEMLLFLEGRRDRDDGWLDRLTADHADPKARAAEISDNPAALKALVTFDKALAYEDARSHLYAKKLFTYAGDQWPELTEAYVNAGLCSLLFYYDSLPRPVRNQWWQPDFGPLITNPHKPIPQGDRITQQDRDAWRDAVTDINLAISKNSGSEEAKALLALAQVLEPDANKDVVQKGIDWFKAKAAATTDPGLELRYANNAGVGFQRIGDLQSAYASIIAAQRGNNVFNAALGENLGLVTVKNRSKEDDELAADVMYTWLSNTPQTTSPRWNTVKKTFDEVCATAGIKAKEIETTPGYLCRVTTLVTDGKEFGLLLPVSGVKKLLGEPEKEVYFAEQWKDLTELRWHAGATTMLTERGNVMRITSYESGATIELKPVDRTSQMVIPIKVGMTKDEFFTKLSEKASVQKNLAKGGKVEVWNYYPSLGIGVLIDGDKVTGITVTPVQYEETGD